MKGFGMGVEFDRSLMGQIPTVDKVCPDYVYGRGIKL